MLDQSQVIDTVEKIQLDSTGKRVEFKVEKHLPAESQNTQEFKDELKTKIQRTMVEKTESLLPKMPAMPKMPKLPRMPSSSEDIIYDLLRKQIV